MLDALIPVSEALEETGGTQLISHGLSSVAGGLPLWAAVGLILIAAMAATPFLNNAATVLVMAPIAAAFARLGAPLSLIVIFLGVPLILFFWPVG